MGDALGCLLVVALLTVEPTYPWLIYPHSLLGLLQQLSNSGLAQVVLIQVLILH